MLTVNNKITSDFKEKFEYVLLNKHKLSNNVTLHDQTFRYETHYIRLCFMFLLTVYYFLYYFKIRNLKSIIDNILSFNFDKKYRQKKVFIYNGWYYIIINIKKFLKLIKNEIRRRNRKMENFSWFDKQAERKINY